MTSQAPPIAGASPTIEESEIATDFDIILEQGATFRLQATWRAGGVLVDLTGYTARMQVRSAAQSDTVLAEFTSTASDITLGSNGLISVSKLVDVPNLSRRGVYDLELVSPGGLVYRVLSGTVQIFPVVTQIVPTTTPTWLPEGAIAFADFVNGRYYAGEAETTAANVVSDPSKITGSGLSVVGATDNAVSVIGDFLAALLQTNATIVATYTGQRFTLVANNDDDSNELWYVESAPTFSSAGAYDNTNSIYPDNGGAPGTGTNRYALTFSSTGLSVSHNGNAVLSASGELAATATRVLMGAYNSTSPVPYDETLISLAVYPPQLDADLPVLSHAL